MASIGEKIDTLINQGKIKVDDLNSDMKKQYAEYNENKNKATIGGTIKTNLAGLWGGLGNATVDSVSGLTDMVNNLGALENRQTNNKLVNFAQDVAKKTPIGAIADFGYNAISKPSGYADLSAEQKAEQHDYTKQLIGATQAANYGNEMASKNKVYAGANFVGSSVGSVVPTLATAYATGGAGVGVQAFSQIMGSESDEMVKNGSANTYEEAQLRALPYAIAGAAIERLGGIGGDATKEAVKQATQGSLRYFLGEAASEGMEEVIEEIVDKALDLNLNKNQNKRLNDAVKNNDFNEIYKIFFDQTDSNAMFNVQNLLTQFGGGAIGGATFGGINKIASNTQLGRQANAQEVNNLINNGDVKYEDLNRTSKRNYNEFYNPENLKTDEQKQTFLGNLLNRQKEQNKQKREEIKATDFANSLNNLNNLANEANVVQQEYAPSQELKINNEGLDKYYENEFSKIYKPATDLKIDEGTFNRYQMSKENERINKQYEEERQQWLDGKNSIENKTRLENNDSNTINSQEKPLKIENMKSGDVENTQKNVKSIERQQKIDDYMDKVYEREESYETSKLGYDFTKETLDDLGIKYTSYEKDNNFEGQKVHSNHFEIADNGIEFYVNDEGQIIIPTIDDLENGYDVDEFFEKLENNDFKENERKLKATQEYTDNFRNTNKVETQILDKLCKDFNVTKWVITKKGTSEYSIDSDTISLSKEQIDKYGFSYCLCHEFTHKLIAENNNKAGYEGEESRKLISSIVDTLKEYSPKEYKRIYDNVKEYYNTASDETIKEEIAVDFCGNILQGTFDKEAYENVMINNAKGFKKLMLTLKQAVRKIATVIDNVTGKTRDVVAYNQAFGNKEVKLYADRIAEVEQNLKDLINAGRINGAVVIEEANKIVRTKDIASKEVVEEIAETIKEDKEINSDNAYENAYKLFEKLVDEEITKTNNKQRIDGSWERNVVKREATENDLLIAKVFFEQEFYKYSPEMYDVIDDEAFIKDEYGDAYDELIAKVQEDYAVKNNVKEYTEEQLMKQREKTRNIGYEAGATQEINAEIGRTANKTKEETRNEFFASPTVPNAIAYIKNEFNGNMKYNDVQGTLKILDEKIEDARVIFNDGTKKSSELKDFENSVQKFRDDIVDKIDKELAKREKKNDTQRTRKFNDTYRDKAGQRTILGSTIIKNTREDYKASVVGNEKYRQISHDESAIKAQNIINSYADDTITTKRELLQRVRDAISNKQIDRDMEVPVLVNIGLEYDSMNDSEGAIAIYNQLDEIARQSGRNAEYMKEFQAKLLKNMHSTSKIKWLENTINKYNETAKPDKQIKWDKDAVKKQLEQVDNIRQNLDKMSKENARKVLKETLVSGANFNNKYEKAIITDTELLERFTNEQMLDTIENEILSKELNKGDVKLARKISTYQVMSHLLNTSTMLRNIGGNTAFAGMERLTSKVQKAIGDKIFKDYKGLDLDKKQFKNIMQKSWDKGMQDLAYNLIGTQGINNKYSNGNVKGASTLNGTIPTFKNKALASGEKALTIGLNVPDAMAKVFAEETFKQEFINAYGVEEYNNMREEVEEYAKEYALYSTFQDDSLPAQLMGDIKKGLNKVSSAITGTEEFGLGDFLIRYTQVPGNIVSRTIEYSPAGLVKGIREIINIKSSNNVSKVAQYKAIMSLSRGITGSALMALGLLLRKAGILTGDETDDEILNKIYKQGGVSTGKINLNAIGRKGSEVENGDLLVSYDWLQPVSMVISTGATIYDVLDGKTSAGKGLTTLSAAAENMLDLPCNQTINTILDAVSYDYTDTGNAMANIGYGFIQSAANGTTGFIPSPIRHLANAVDPTSRNVYSSDNNIIEETGKKVANSIPFVSYGVEPFKTANGDELKYSDFGWLMNFVIQASPLRTTQVDLINGTKDYAKLLTSSTGESYATKSNTVVRYAPNKTYYKGTTYEKGTKLTDKDKTQYMEAYAEYYNKHITPYLEKQSQLTLNDKQKEKIADKLAELNKAAKQYAEKYAMNN